MFHDQGAVSVGGLGDGFRFWWWGSRCGQDQGKRECKGYFGSFQGAVSRGLTWATPSPIKNMPSGAHYFGPGALARSRIGGPFFWTFASGLAHYLVLFLGCVWSQGLIWWF